MEPTPGRHTIGSQLYYEMFQLWKRLPELPKARMIYFKVANPFVETMAMDLMPTAERIQWAAINTVPDQLRIAVNHLKRGFKCMKNRQPEEAAKTFEDFSTAHIEVVLNHMN